MTKLIMLFSLTAITSGILFQQKNNSSANSSSFNNGDTQPVELGKVAWLRDLGEATKLSAKTNKPIFLLFQEVPGCSTCQHYGTKVLSHPLIVEAIETYFVPLAIYNNKKGKDQKVLNYFREPAWNNPVVRFIDHRKQNLTERISGNYTPLAVVAHMIQVLTSEGIAIPEYLTLLARGLKAESSISETAYLSMSCFWTGEKKIAGIDGVIETQAGFMDGREVVKATFDPKIIAYESLIRQAQAQSCANHVYTDNLIQQLSAEKIIDSVSEKKAWRQDKETKYYLYKSSYKYVPMTGMQATQANRLIGLGHSPDSILSPRQLALLEYIRKYPNLNWSSSINMDIILAWDQVAQQINN